MYRYVPVLGIHRGTYSRVTPLVGLFLDVNCKPPQAPWRHNATRIPVRFGATWMLGDTDTTLPNSFLACSTNRIPSSLQDGCAYVLG
jgi:hypothetical protein